MNKFKNLFLYLTKSKVVKSGTWYLISEIVLKGMAFITIPIFTRLLTVEDYGIVSVFASLVGVMAVITGADLQITVGRAKQDFGNNYKRFFSSVLILSLIFFLCAICFVVVFLKPLSELINISQNLLLLSVVTGYASFVSGYYSFHLLFMQKYKKRSILKISRAISQVILSILLILLMTQNKYMGKIYGQVLVTISFAVVIFFIIMKTGKTFFFRKAWFYSAKIGVPLIPHELSGIILNQFDRLAIQSIIGSSATGLYSFSYNIGMLSLIVLHATNSAWLPWFYKQKESGSVERIRLALRIYIVGILITNVTLMMLGPEIALILAPGNYLGGLRIVSVIVLSYFIHFLFSIFVHFSFYKKKTLSVSIGSFAAGCINIFLNILLIPIFGYEIAAWTTAISYFCLLLFHWYNINVRLKDKTIKIRTMLLYLILAFLITLQQYITMKYLPIFSPYERALRFGISLLVITFLLIKGYKALTEFSKTA